MTEEDKYISIKFRWISFVLAVMVVLIHANSLRGVAEVPAAAQTFHATLGYLIWSPVPIFFIISGYFFGLSNYVREGGYRSFIVKKCRTLLVPYVIFALLGTIMAMPLMLALNHIKNLPWYDRTVFAGEHWWQWLDALLGVTAPCPLHNSTLWYVRAIFVLFLFAPLWRFLIHKLPNWIFLLPAVYCYLFVRDYYYDAVPILEVRLSAVWFFVGICISRFRTILRPTKRPHTTAVLGLLTLLMMLHVPYSGRLVFWLPLIQFSFIWTSFDIAFGSKKGLMLPEFAGLSFWIYCTHTIITNWIVPVGHYVLGEGALALCFVTVVNFAICLAITISSGLWLKRRHVRLYEMLSGGR